MRPPFFWLNDMARDKITETLQDITEPVAQSLGLKLWGIDVLQSGRPIVRIYVDVDKEQENSSEQDMAAHSATVEQCAKISRLVGLALEVEDVFSSAYVLEVSSPGLSRPFFELAQMASYIGDNIEIVLADFLPQTDDLPPFAKGRKKFAGELIATTEQTLKLNIENGGEHYPIEFIWESVRKATRVHTFVMPEKPGKKRKDNKEK